MNFAGIGPAELALILIIAILIFGPAKLPEIAKDLGETIKKWRQALDDITGDLDRSPAQPATEDEMQAAIQKVAKPGHVIDVPSDANTSTDGASSDGGNQEQEPEAETECQTYSG